ncbi:MAG: hypothetical protein K6G22_00515 [Lachnospiraceae bacterium]|nr:hypothetical protein [Lachnospiraceae bacterium]
MDSIPDDEVIVVDQREIYTDIFTAVGDLTGKAMGVWIRFWEDAQNRFDTNAHWATIWDVVKDAANRIVGILLVDSDNDAAADPYNDSTTDEEKQETDPARRAALAARMPDSYTYYEIANAAFSVIEDGENTGYIKLVSYGGEFYTALIGAILTLADYSSSGGNSQPAVVIVNPDQNKEDRNEDTHGTSEAVAPGNDTTTALAFDPKDPTAVLAVLEAVKAAMIQNNLVLFAPTGNIYDKNINTGYSMIIRRMYRALANVYINGKRIPDNGKYYNITETPNGMFMITFTDDYMRALGDGEYSVRMDFIGADDINITVSIK